MSSLVLGVLLFAVFCLGWATFDVLRQRRRNHEIVVPLRLRH